MKRQAVYFLFHSGFPTILSPVVQLRITPDACRPRLCTDGMKTSLHGACLKGILP
jgi:hypothetical protein